MRILESLILASKNVLDFVLVKFFHVVASRTEIFARVKFFRMFGEYLTYGGGHCKTAVRVDVDLAYCAFSGLAELFFGNTDCVGKLASILVDSVDFFLGN